MTEKIILNPSSQNLLTSLRSLGYKPDSAIADIIDNCIAAYATEIHVDFNWNTDNPLKSSICIYDNGSGMDRGTLISSMKIGSSDFSVPRRADDLGRFGLGMKTAALSLGKRLSVYTKGGGSVSSACWDLNEIERDKDGIWNLIVDLDDVTKEADKLSGFENGTLVKIDDLDLLLGDISSKNLKNSFYYIIGRVKDHVKLTFHRFMEEDGLKIYFKNELLTPWNPFFSNLAATQEAEDYIGDENPIIVHSYVLPRDAKISEEERKQLKIEGYRGWNVHQGIYLYRNRRLLVYGTWFDIISKEESFNLARIKLDITSDLDEYWNIDIRKSVATPPLDVVEKLRPIVNRCTARSYETYSSRGGHTKGKSTQELDIVWEQRQNSRKEYTYRLNKKHPIYIELQKQLDDALLKKLKVYLRLVEEYAPFAYSKSIEGQEGELENENMDVEKARDLEEAKGIIREMFKNNFEKGDVMKILLKMPTYKYIKKELEQIFEEENYD